MIRNSLSARAANQNEKKHSPNMLVKTKNILKRCGAKLRRVIADSQYSDGKLRKAVDETVNPANQKRDVKGLLRVDKKFRTYGPEDQKREYHKRPHIENYKITAEDNAGNSIATDSVIGYSYQYQVIPEFPSFLVLPLLIAAMLLTATVYGRKHSSKLT